MADKSLPPTPTVQTFALDLTASTAGTGTTEAPSTTTGTAATAPTTGSPVTPTSANNLLVTFLTANDSSTSSSSANSYSAGNNNASTIHRPSIVDTTAGSSSTKRPVSTISTAASSYSRSSRSSHSEEDGADKDQPAPPTSDTSPHSQHYPSSSPSPLPPPPPPPQTTAPVSTRYPKDFPELDFEEFLRQLRQPQAYMITRYFKSFLREFQRKRWTPTEQIKIVQDFVGFALEKILTVEPWSQQSPHDGDSMREVAREGLEKLVMTKLYSHTFCPATSNDAALDRELSLKIKYFRWIREEHLDIPEGLRHAAALEPAQKGIFLKRFSNGIIMMNFHGLELNQLNRYKAPRDKLVCVLNCCKLIMGKAAVGKFMVLPG